MGVRGWVKSVTPPARRHVCCLWMPRRKHLLTSHSCRSSLGRTEFPCRRKTPREVPGAQPRFPSNPMSWRTSRFKAFTARKRGVVPIAQRSVLDSELASGSTWFFAIPCYWDQMLLRLTQQDDVAIIRVWVDRSIPGTSESFARSLRLRKRAWNISFDADGQRGSFAQNAPVSRAPS